MIVADAGPLIVFARIGRLSLLRAVAGEVVIPEAVHEETAAIGQHRAGSAAIAASPWIRRQALDHSAASSEIPHNLHRGEREAIVLARQLNVRLLMDERRGRQAARAVGVEVVGSLAVLANAKRQGVLERVGPLVRDMMDAGYWLAPDLVAAFLTEVGEGDDLSGL